MSPAMMYAATTSRDVSSVRLDPKAHRDAADGTVSSGTFQLFQYSMYYSELSGQTEQASASASQGSTEGGGQGSAAPAFDLNLGTAAETSALLGADK
jgi:hypothetical protein